MKRTLEAALNRWKSSPTRMPLLLRGARQVGKTHLVRQWGQEHYSSFVELNFELSPELEACFKTLNPIDIINRLEGLTGSRIVPGQSLLFFDEIQQCPQAIMALRYFKEKLPELHVIGAGSLLEFALNETDFSFPVGRVEFATLRPLSFMEFLEARALDKMISVIQHATPLNPPDEVIHDKLSEHVREYLATGGMPGAVAAFLPKRSFVDTRHIQSQLLNTYRLDFPKYASKAEHKYLQRFFTRAPALVGEDFKYTHVDPEVRSRELGVALDQLCWAGLLHRVQASAASGLPLSAHNNTNKFKLLYLDIGLMLCALQTDPQLILDDDIALMNAGNSAEQLVGQELLYIKSSDDLDTLHYWKREKTGSTAQVDYVIRVGQHIVPIEVKSGNTGRLKSLRLFIDEKKSSIGVKISQSPLQLHGDILSVPFYLISQLDRLVADLK